jgi:hypothetical protein
VEIGILTRRAASEKPFASTTLTKIAGACLAIGGLSYMAVPHLPTREVVIVVFTLGLSLAAVIVVISQAVVSEFVPVAHTIIGAIMFTGGLIAMLFIRPEREAKRRCQDRMRVPLPAPGLSWEGQNPYENVSETYRAVDDVPSPRISLPAPCKAARQGQSFPCFVRKSAPRH